MGVATDIPAAMGVTPDAMGTAAYIRTEHGTEHCTIRTEHCTEHCTGHCTEHRLPSRLFAAAAELFTEALRRWVWLQTYLLPWE